jgi:HD superfamily phosphodiesterase
MYTPYNMSVTIVEAEQIMRTAQLILHNQSPAHDFQHVLRVYKNAEMIAKEEGQSGYSPCGSPVT